MADHDVRDAAARRTPVPSPRFVLAASAASITFPADFAAFESGRLSEETAAPRIEVLKTKLRELEATKRQLVDRAEEQGPEPPTGADLARLVAELTDAASRLAKAIVQQLVAEVSVESRSSIKPVFRVPQRGVRILDGKVDPRGFEPLTF